MPNKTDGNMRSGGDNSADGGASLEQRLSGLPSPFGRVFGWVRRTEARWVRVPASAALIVGGLIGFLPILGFRRVPLGAVQEWWDSRRGMTWGRL